MAVAHVTVTVRMPPELYERLRARLASSQTTPSLNVLILTALEAFVKEKHGL